MKLNDISKTVVVPFDYSELSIEGLKQAIEMVDDISMIRVIHVTQYPSAYEYGVVWETISPETIAKQVRESFTKQLDENSLPIALDFKVAFGNPGIEICNYAKEVDAELIVVPSHGRSGVNRFLLGSVAERILRSAPCPVLVLRKDNQLATEVAENSLATQAG